MTTADCVFCAADVVSAAVATGGSVYAIPDRNPVSLGHVLVVPRRHTPDLFGLTAGEQRDALELLRRLRADILSTDSTVEGFNVGANCGEVAGQTIPHAHLHLIPRRRGDTPRPRGGVRGVIPERMNY